ACRNMLAYLAPDALGSADQMLAFARACAATRNWTAGLPHLLHAAHEQIAMAEQDRGYWLRKAVADDVQGLIDSLLQQCPAGVYARELAAQWASRSGKY